MIASNAQIVQLYEELDQAPDRIAQILDMDVGVVLISLASSSAKFRADRAKEQFGEVNPHTLSKTELYSEEEVREAAQAMLQLVRFSDDENVRARCAKFIVNEGKGRHDVKATSGLNINVHLINDQLKRAREVKEVSRNKVIDVPANVLELMKT